MTIGAVSKVRCQWYCIIIHILFRKVQNFVIKTDRLTKCRCTGRLQSVGSLLETDKTDSNFGPVLVVSGCVLVV